MYAHGLRVEASDWGDASWPGEAEGRRVPTPAAAGAQTDERNEI